MTVLPAGLVQPVLQRVAARGDLSARHAEGRTRLQRLFQEGAAKIRFPAGEGDPLEAILINTAGGLTGGDRIAWSVEVGENASVSITTQACEKVYRTPGGRAEATCSITVAPGGRVAWLPQETIVYDRSAFRRRLDVELGTGAEALLLEATVFGRLAMGEVVRLAEFRDRWRIRAEDRLVHAEEFAVGPDVVATLAPRAATGGATAMATLLLVAPDAADRLDRARAIIGDGGGASAWSVGPTGKLLARLVAEDAYRLRARLCPLVALLNGQAGLPKTWSL